MKLGTIVYPSKNLQNPSKKLPWRRRDVIHWGWRQKNPTFLKWRYFCFYSTWRVGWPLVGMRINKSFQKRKAFQKEKCFWGSNFWWRHHIFDDNFKMTSFTVTALDCHEILQNCFLIYHLTSVKVWSHFNVPIQSYG